MTSPALPHYIDGERVRADASNASLNPSNTDEVVALFPEGGEAEVDAAVQAARRAFPAWSEASPELRSDCLDRVGDAILNRREELGHLLSREEGRPWPRASVKRRAPGASSSTLPARRYAATVRTWIRCAPAWRSRPTARPWACSD